MMNVVCRALMLLLVGLAGCQQIQEMQAPLPQLYEADAALQQGQAEQAFRMARRIADERKAPDRAQAARVAGLAAMQLERFDDAEEYLRQAAVLGDDETAGYAWADLGLLYARQERYDDSANALLEAAQRLPGEEKAKAYFFAGVAQQKLDRLPQARTSFRQAQAATQDPQLRQQIQEQLGVTGYTIQTGAYEDRDNDRRAAEELAQQAQSLHLGSPRLVTATTPQGRPVTLVQVGQFTTYGSAQDARNQLSAGRAIIVPLAD